MFDLYTAVILTAILLLSTTIADVVTNRLITKKMKIRSMIACLLIAASALGECIGVLTNGASVSLIVLHKAAKLIEFSCAPAIGVAVGMAYGVVKRPRVGMAVVGVHAAFECVALCFDWVFSIDAQNVYHREEWYLIYVIAFVISVVYCFTCVIRSGKEYQTGIDSVLVLTLLLVIVGIGIQFVNSGIRIDFLCIAIGNMMLYSRYYKMILQVDAVTRLLNRRCYDANIGNVGSRAVIISFDINRFKQVNDTYGHSVGDICLKNVAEQLRKVYGKCGSCYRVGGDEFCVILNSNFEQLEELNKQFTDEIALIQKADQRMPAVALGYAYYDADTSHIQNVIEEADAMMYKNKNSLC
ncbi:MAG: GGDEF domain-containing protein [Lachnospiraceae bacterium]